VYFDNIKVTKINRPVVIIPGHGASISFKEMFLNQENADDWRMLPGVHTYNNLINTFIANGYKEGEDLFVFYYNWLNPISETAGKLHQFIEEKVLVSSDNTQVNIVGHSMGGLVDSDDCFVNHLITVGSPHRGVLETYAAWEGGQVWRQGFSKLAFELFLNSKKEFGETKQQTLQRLAPSTQDMLPDFAYLKNEDGGEIAFGETNYPQNNLFSQIGGAGELEEKASFIYGNNKETLRWLRVDQDLNWFDEVLGNWPHGKPVEKEFSSAGDGTVLEMSAYPEASMSGTVFNLDHQEIISGETAINKINEILEIEGQAVVEDWQKTENFLVFYIHSPAYLEMEGLTNEMIFEGKEDSKTKLFIVANPLLEKTYRINVVGDGEGQYSLLIGKMINNNLTWETYQGKAVPEQTDVFDIKFTASLTFIEETAEEQIKPLLYQLITDLEEGLTETALLDKIAQLKILIEIDYELALEYAYQIRNFASLLAKETAVDFDLTATVAEIDKIILYLKTLAGKSYRSVESIEANANYQDSTAMLDFLKPLPYSSLETKAFLSLAANDFLVEKNDFSEAEKLINDEQFYSGWLLSRSSYYLGKNNKILLN